MKSSSKYPATSTLPPPPHWNEKLFQLLARVIDAVTYDQAPGMRTLFVAEYLSRASKAEFAALMREMRGSRRRGRAARAKRGRPPGDTPKDRFS